MELCSIILYWYILTASVIIEMFKKRRGVARRVKICRGKAVVWDNKSTGSPHRIEAVQRLQVVSSETRPLAGERSGGNPLRNISILGRPLPSYARAGSPLSSAGGRWLEG